MNNPSSHNSRDLDNAGQLEACDIPQDRYRVFIQDVADAFFETTIQGDFIFFNDALCRIFGYPREEIENQNFRHFMDSTNAEFAFNSFNRMFDSGKGVNNILWEICRKDGETRIIEINANLLEDTKGKKVGFQGIARDVTDKVKAEQALKASEKQTQEQYMSSRRAEQRYRSFLEFIPVPVFVFNMDGTVFYDDLIWEPEELKEFEADWGVLKDEYAKPAEKFERKRFTDLNIKADHLYVTGCINSIDMPNPGWGGGDGYRNFFLGDTTGLMRIAYQSGQIDVIPLVYGYTAWWYDCYKGHPEPFRSDSGAKKMLGDALCVINGIDGYRQEKEDFYLKIVLRDNPVSWIELEDNPKRIGYYRINGLSFGNPENKHELDNSAFVIKRRAESVSGNMLLAIDKHLIHSANPFPTHRQEAISRLRHKFYTSIDDINEQVINKTSPDIDSKNFPGPHVSFSGSDIATLLTHIYYENSMQIIRSIDDEGMVHESIKGANNYQSFGSWNEGLGAFYDCAYTRNRSMIVLSNYGLEEKVNKGIAFFDKWMMYYPESYPEIQLGGEPVPGHASVIANTPHVYYDKLRHLGWGTKYTSRDFGNPENDGHGFLMLTRYRAWLKQGGTREWVVQRWEALDEAAEYIPWCLDHPQLSFSENGLLYNESEGGMMQQSMYCDYLCYLGLLAYAEMADIAGRPDKSERWEEEANRLYSSMEAYYPAYIEPWGEVWDPTKNGMFLYINSTLAPACIGMDYHGYNVMKKLPDDWVERTRNTFQMQLSRCRPAYAASAGMGYGQCYIAQTGLLLDEMEKADYIIEWMARLCFTPRLDHPYRVPEGATISEDGKTWRRWGDLGNLYQMVDVVHTLHLMIGIDDIDPDQLILMPRLTSQIDQVKVDSWPTRFKSKGNTVLEELDMTMEIDRNRHKILFSLVSGQTVDHARIRLGPIPAGSSDVQVWKNGKETAFEQIASGDSDWIWVPAVEGLSRKTDIKVTF